MPGALGRISGSRSARGLLVAAALGGCLCTGASAQGRGPGAVPPGGGGRDGGGMAPQGGGAGNFGPGMSRGPIARSTRDPAPSIAPQSQGGLQLGLTGRWWDNKNIARSVGLNPVQQHRLDDVFGANRDNLMTLYKNLQHEDSLLHKLTRSAVPDENQIYQQIDRVTRARGELEKANAHMLLQIRKELTPEQASRLDEQTLP